VRVAQRLLCLRRPPAITGEGEEETMNKKNASRKLVLNRATIRNLTATELGGVVGGMINQSRVTQCDCPTFLCDEPVPSSQANTGCTRP
jgi:hypothetical protein